MTEIINPQQWLKELQEKLEEDAKFASEQLAQAQPVYYVIRDYRLDIVPDGYGDIIKYVDRENCVDYTPREAIESLLEDDDLTVEDITQSFDGQTYDIIFTEDEKVDQSVPEWKCCAFLDEYEPAQHLERRCFAVVPYIVSDTMFLTHKEAAAHLKANYYHYTKDAHTYAMTAWRSPQVRDLLQLLRTIDFDASDIKFKEHDTINAS